MRSNPRLATVNLALVSLYFVPIWGGEGLRVLLSPYHGFEDPAHAIAASFFRQLFDLGLDGVLRTSHLLAGAKLVIAAGFVAYLIEFSRSLVIGRNVDRQTLDTVTAMAVGGIALFALPAMMLGDPGLVRLYATQLLLLAGAVVVITIDRYIEPEDKPAAAAEYEREPTPQAVVVPMAAEDRRLGLPSPQASSSHG